MFDNDFLIITVNSKEDVDIINETWKEMYNSDFPVNFAISGEAYTAKIENETIFEGDDMTGRNAITYLLMRLAEKDSKASFSCYFKQFFDVWDLTYTTKYNYSNCFLSIELTDFQPSTVYTCDECKDDFFARKFERKPTPLFTADCYDNSKKYICPICKCDMREKDKRLSAFDPIMPYYKKYELKYEDSNWILPEKFKITNDFGELYEE